MLMQKAAKENLILYQMDVKTAYLHAPIDYEIYVEQPEGYDVKSQTNEKMLCKLKKSLYGWRVIRCRSALIIAGFQCISDFQRSCDFIQLKRVGRCNG